jgi:hypothetical protein
MLLGIGSHVLSSSLPAMNAALGDERYTSSRPTSQGIRLPEMSAALSGEYHISVATTSGERWWPQ